MTAYISGEDLEEILLQTFGEENEVKIYLKFLDDTLFKAGQQCSEPDLEAISVNLDELYFAVKSLWDYHNDKRNRKV